MTFLLAGHETTSVAMAWVVYMMSQHPDIHQKVVDEIDRVMGDSTEVTMEKVDKMTYLENVIKETLRLYPPVTMTSRNTVHDDTLGGYAIPKGVSYKELL
jgi:cytochrome P450